SIICYYLLLFVSVTLYFVTRYFCKTFLSTLNQRSALIGPQCSSSLRLVYEALQGAGNVFDLHQPDLGVGGVSWDDGKLDNFQNVLYQLLEHRCFSERVSSGQLEPYFSDVTALLNKQLSLMLH
uniref:Uncharacterized protein n=1 Tax=Neogobius melanostomus TaxID=47308 RepID=A0A8C6V0K4_9GOBI